MKVPKTAVNLMDGFTSAGPDKRLKILKRAIDEWCPDYEPNPWSEWMLTTLTLPPVEGSRMHVTALSGCATAGKTFTATLYAWFWWLAAPEISSVVLCTTTVLMLRRRIWPHIITCYSGTPESIRGYMVNSKNTVQAIENNDLSALFALAVMSGDTQMAVQRLKGIHNERILLVVDEAEGTPEAIMATIPNLRKSCDEFQLIVIGNAASKFDPHGRVCTPRDGWESVTVETQAWPTAGVPEWQIDAGRCLHFDGFKSPNVLAKKTIFPRIYTYEDYCEIQKHPARSHSIGYWSHDRGFWLPDDLNLTVFVSSFFRQNKESFEFKDPIRVAALDPAFATDGDQCIAAIALVGKNEKNDFCVQLQNLHRFNLQASHGNVDYAIADWFISLCQEYEVPPENAGIEASGVGRGVYAIVAERWDHGVIRLEAGEKPSDQPAGPDDQRPANTVYFNAITYAWFYTRELARQGRVRGVDEAAVKQGCQRGWVRLNNKIRLEDKTTYRSRFNCSPDEMDATAWACDVARRVMIGTLSYAGRSVVWHKWRQETDERDDYNGVTQQNAVVEYA